MSGCARSVFVAATALAAASLPWSNQLNAASDGNTVAQAAALASPASEPSARLVSPPDGALVSGPTMLIAEVIPRDAAASAVFFVDGREVCRRTAPPFECGWNAGATVASHHVRLVVNLRTGGRLVHTVRTATAAFAEIMDVDVVEVSVTITDDNGRYVTGLPRSAFHVSEDGKPQAISHFYASDAPLELVVALDLSGSMIPALPAMKRAVAALLATLPAGYGVTLLGFNNEVFTLLPRSAPTTERTQVVNSLSAWGMTALYEGVIHGVEALGSRPGRKALLVFTDGQDQGSHVTLQEVEQTLHASDLILYMIGQGEGIVSEPLQQLMDRLARPTGGRTVSTTSIDALQSAFGDLFAEMSHQYVLGYQSSSDAPADRWREITVKVDGHSRVRARQGYRPRVR